MKFKKVIKEKPGTKVYLVSHGNIKTFTLLGYHPKYEKYYYLVDDSNVHKAFGIHIPSEEEFWSINYNEAKAEMWRQQKQKIKSINDIYFEGGKSLIFKEDEE